MAHYRFDVVLQNANGLPTDRYVNSLHIDISGGTPATTAAAVATILGDAFNVAHGGQPILATFIGPQASRSAQASKIIWYDMAEAEPRTPHPVTWTLGPSATAPDNVPLPAEVACVLSLQATGLNGPSYRGRVYIGPLNVGAAGATESGDSRPNTFFQYSLRNAAQYIADQSQTNGAVWSIFSRKLGILTPTTHGYIDNAWDTQRRRGLAPSTRMGWLKGA
jgi:hypothetical protein